MQSIFLVFLAQCLHLTSTLPHLPSLQIDTNVVDVVIFGESRCIDTIKFFQKHLMPTWQLLGKTERLNIKYYPYGVKASCIEEESGNIECLCQHGALECGLNALQACVIQEVPRFADHIDYVSCIMGRWNVTDAARECITGGNGPSAERILSCGKSNEGRRLLLEDGTYQKLIAPTLNWVPHVRINGVHSIEAQKSFGHVVCQNLRPQPEECARNFN